MNNHSIRCKVYNVHSDFDECDIMQVGSLKSKRFMVEIKKDLFLGQFS